jgi:virginiamycin B lyase
VWFTEAYGNNIGRASTTGAITEYPIPTANSYPFGIVTGPANLIWFVESQTSKVGYSTLSGSVSDFAGETTGSPLGVAFGPDGGLWYADQAANQIGRLCVGG